MAASAWRQLRSTSASAQAVTASAGVDSGPMAAPSGGHLKNLPFNGSDINEPTSWLRFELD
nr:hypothetical protein Iba_chr09cCG12250 [Ipomoea batatas]